MAATRVGIEVLLARLAVLQPRPQQESGFLLGAHLGVNKVLHESLAVAFDKFSPRTRVQEILNLVQVQL